MENLFTPTYFYFFVSLTRENQPSSWLSIHCHGSTVSHHPLLSLGNQGPCCEINLSSLHIFQYEFHLRDQARLSWKDQKWWKEVFPLGSQAPIVGSSRGGSIWRAASIHQQEKISWHELHLSKANENHSYNIQKMQTSENVFRDVLFSPTLRTEVETKTFLYGACAPHSTLVWDLLRVSQRNL